MKKTALAVIISVAAAVPAAAQDVCAAAPVRMQVVQFFDRWYDAVGKMQLNAAFDDTAALLPISSESKRGYVLLFDQMVSFTNDCPSRPASVVEQNSPGWHRRILDTPALAEAFIAGLPRTTPVGFSTVYAGYAAGAEDNRGRLRAVGHETWFAPRGVVVVWYDPNTP